jgi:hypothetical protein
MRSTKYYYRESTPVWYNGCYFHSILELKYVLTIEQDYYYIREPVVIPYDPHTQQLPAGWGCNHQFYIPDLLIRHKGTNEAFLIEIKPGNYTEEDALRKREKLSNAFIKKQMADWKYLLVQEDMICLDAAQKQKLEAIKASAVSDKPYVRSFYSIVPEQNGTSLSMADYVYMVKNGKRRKLSQQPAAVLHSIG